MLLIAIRQYIEKENCYYLPKGDGIDHPTFINPLNFQTVSVTLANSFETTAPHSEVAKMAKRHFTEDIGYVDLRLKLQYGRLTVITKDDFLKVPANVREFYDDPRGYYAFGHLIEQCHV
jgi:hypothetical protein